MDTFKERQALDDLVRARRYALAGLEDARGACSASGGLTSAPSSPSGRTATTSRSAPARRFCGWCGRTRARASSGWCWPAAGARGARGAGLAPPGSSTGAGGAEVLLEGFRDGHFPADWAAIKAFFETLKRFEPDLVLTH